MEITYDLIIKYLSNKNNFTTPKNIFNYSSNFIQKFKDLFTEGFYRYGITTYNKNNTNISIWSSILTALDKDFDKNVLKGIDMYNEALTASLVLMRSEPLSKLP